MTPEGRAVVEAIDRAGVWKRAGMAGAVIGLDIAEALVGLPPQVDQEFCRRLLIIAERAYIVAWHRHTAETKGS